MTRRRFASGAFLFTEGTACEFVAHLVEGEIEVTRNHDGRPVVLGHLHAGDYCGEMAALSGGVHQASARALGAVSIECIDTPDFLRHVSGDSRLALRLLERLSEHLRHLDAEYAALAAPTGQAPVEAPRIATEAAATATSVRLAAGSADLAAILPAAGIALPERPFVVGRRTSHPGEAATTAVDLLLDDVRPYRLSRRHFAIVRRGGDVEVRDLGSHLGTLVNDAGIGRVFSHDVATLHPGENVVVAGGRCSPFVFRVLVGA